MKTKVEYSWGKEGSMAFVGLVVVASLFSFFTGSSLFAPTRTVAETTVTSTATSTSVYTSIFTVSTTFTQTVTTAEVITYVGPPAVIMSGTARSNTAGTSAQEIEFVPSGGGSPIISSVTSGSYQLSLPNREFYTVEIVHSGIVGGLAAGTCTAGGLVLFSEDNATTADWSC